MNKYKLKDVCYKIYSGGTPSTKENKYWNGSIPWLSSSESGQDFVYKANSFITEIAVEETSTKFVSKNTVVMATAGEGKTRGQVCYLKIDACISQSMIALEVDKNKIDSLFLFYYLKNSYSRIRSLSDATGVRGSLSGSLLKEFYIFIPELEKQKKISDLLYKLDKKIQNNNKQIQTLESLAKTIYDYWFVQFDFPNEDGRPYKSSGGKMVWNEELKREIPEGWGCSSLEDQLLILKDGTHNPPKRINEGIPLLTGNIFGDFFINKENATYISKEDYQKIHSQYHPIEGDLILTKIGTIGGVNYLRDEDLPLAIHCNSALLRYKNSFGKYFPLFLMKSEIFQNRLRAMKGQSVQEFVSLSRLGSILIEVPMTNVISAFNSRIESIMKNIEKVYSENEHLISLRKFLLPLLMNGQVTIFNHT